MADMANQIPLTADLFDAMFASEEFRSRAKALWQEFEREKAREEHRASLASARLHGTEGILKEEFWKKPDATDAEIDERRQALYAEFDKRFGEAVSA